MKDHVYLVWLIYRHNLNMISRKKKGEKKKGKKNSIIVEGIGTRTAEYHEAIAMVTPLLMEQFCNILLSFISTQEKVKIFDLPLFRRELRLFLYNSLPSKRYFFLQADERGKDDDSDRFECDDI